MSVLGGVPMGGSTSTFTLNPAVAAAYQQMQQQQASGYANLEQQVLGGYQGLYNQAMQNVGTYGQTAALNTGNYYKQLAAQQAQAGLSAGLNNNTIQGSMQGGIAQRASQDLNIMLPEEVSKYKTGVMGQFGGQLYGAMQQMGESGLSAQQQLGAQYLNLLGRQGTTTQQNYGIPQNPFMQPTPGIAGPRSNPGFPNPQTYGSGGSGGGGSSGGMGILPNNVMTAYMGSQGDASALLGGGFYGGAGTSDYGGGFSGADSGSSGGDF